MVIDGVPTTHASRMGAPAWVGGLWGYPLLPVAGEVSHLCGQRGVRGGAMKSKVNVHVPYKMMAERQDEILNASINPEIFFDGRALDSVLSKELIAIGDGFAGRGRRVTMHGPFMDLSPGAADEAIRHATVERFRQTLQAATCLKHADVVLHAGYDDRRFDGDVELWFSQSLKTWEPLIRKDEGMGAVIALENVFEENPFAMGKLMDAFPSKHFGVCLDAGHLNIFSYVAMDNWFETIEPHGEEALQKGLLAVERFLC